MIYRKFLEFPIYQKRSARRRMTHKKNMSQKRLRVSARVSQEKLFVICQESSFVGFWVNFLISLEKAFKLLLITFII